MLTYSNPVRGLTVAYFICAERVMSILGGASPSTTRGSKAMAVAEALISSSVRKFDPMTVDKGKLTIRNPVLIAGRMFISDHNQGFVWKTSCSDDLIAARRCATTSRWQRAGSFGPRHSSPDRLPSTNPVVIGDDVGLGQSVRALSGVTVGGGSTVGVNAVVAEDIPPASIALGAPAQVLRHYEAGKGWVAAV